jgi:hypothetical protein
MRLRKILTTSVDRDALKRHIDIMDLPAQDHVSEDLYVLLWKKDSLFFFMSILILYLSICCSLYILELLFIEHQNIQIHILGKP